MNLVQLRLAHYYAGVFFAPTIIFFALSGVMQVFKLHESYRATPGAQGDCAPDHAAAAERDDLSGRSLTAFRERRKIPDFRLTSPAPRSNLGAHTQGWVGSETWEGSR